MIKKGKIKSRGRNVHPRLSAYKRGDKQKITKLSDGLLYSLFRNKILIQRYKIEVYFGKKVKRVRKTTSVLVFSTDAEVKKTVWELRQ